MRLWSYALTLLVSAFLLFQIQPMFARFLLPYWGGGSGVWSVCLLFFQATLLMGYLYAHGLARRLPMRWGAILHSALLLGSIALLPLSPATDSELAGQLHPSLGLLWLLTRHVALPCILISASAPLLQHWFARGNGTSPYRLYAVSNAGSLLGLLSYPLLVEPLFGLRAQATLWSWGYAGLIALSLLCAIMVYRAHAPNAPAPEDSEELAVTTGATRLLWLALSGAGVVLLLSITTEITTNLVPMPLLWVLPLAIYLLSYILCFARDRPYARRRWLSLFSVAILPTLWLPAIQPVIGPWPAAAVSCVCLFLGCMICHGELARLKPHSKDLSSYYVFLAAGGVLGGAFVNIVAPLVFERYWELAIALFGVFALAGICRLTEASAPSSARPGPVTGLGAPARSRSAVGPGVLIVWALGVSGFAYLGTLPLRAQSSTLAAGRSFYGRLSVVEASANGVRTRDFLHGRIRHGAQFQSETKRQEPTLYFSKDSGVGRVLDHAAYQGTRHVGVVGLGIGTLASYGRAGDRIRFYELDPLVLKFAKRYFTFLSECAAQVDVVLGDGRLSLQREWQDAGSNEFDLLILDAFNADSLPTHLITREAFALYWKHLGDDGTLAVNITNAFLDMAPIVAAQAHALGKEALLLSSPPTEFSRSGSTWVLVTGNPALLEDSNLQERATIPAQRGHSLWTDDYSNVLEALK